jgi:tetratricopeptide (TPR) repeat protein
VAKLWREFWAVPLAILLGMTAGPLCPAIQAQQTGSTNQSWWDSFTTGVKDGCDKLVHPFGSPKPATPVSGPEDEAISLKKQGKAGPGTHVAIAQLYEQSKRTVEAEAEYQMALDESRDFLPALLGYAHLQEQLGKSKEALDLYQHAVRAHPEQAAAHNNLGLCCARQNRLDDAVAAMSRAIQLDPKNPLYRNNIAAALVDQGRISEALVHLRAAHDDAAACYNLGYLLNKKGQPQAALQYFQLALASDPSMEAARRWVVYLQRTMAQARIASNPIASGVRVITPPPQEAEPALPEEPPPRRLPPTAGRQSAADDATPGVAYGSSPPPTAPLPPTLNNSSLRPLPRAD